MPVACQAKHQPLVLGMTIQVWRMGVENGEIFGDARWVGRGRGVSVMLEPYEVGWSVSRWCRRSVSRLAAQYTFGNLRTTRL